MDRVLRQAEEHFRAGDPARAEALCHDVLARAPGNPDALRLLGILHLEGGRAAESIPLLRDALQSDPKNLSALDALSAAFMTVGDFPQAEEMVRRALALDAGLVVARMRLGMALSSQGRWSEAARAFEELVERDPRISDAHHNLGDALTKLHRAPEAIACFRRALAINPDNPDTHNSLGVAFQELRLWDAAFARYERALALDPAYAIARYNIGVAHLFRQEFEPGWVNYDRRLECAPTGGVPRKRKDAASVDLFLRLPRWRGLAEPGVRQVAIWAEQGIGDQILFSTLIPELIASGVPFAYEADRRLLPAYQRAFPGVRFLALDDPPCEELQRASRVLFSGSLPGLFRTNRDSFSRQPARLLGALPERVAIYRDRIQALGSGLKVALSWRSTRQDWWAEKKNATLADFAPLLRLPGVQFVDVQYGDTAAERQAIAAATGVGLLHFDEVDYFNDLEDMLAILEACDLVITTSNATAHMAGALGKRTWLLYPADRAPFHYWAHGGGYRSLWYPSVEIITGESLADWSSLLQAVSARLGGKTLDEATQAADAAVPEAASLPSARDWLGRAKALREEGKLAEAVETCRRGLERAPGNALAWSEMAHALRWQGKLDDALSAAAKAIELAPDLATAWFNLGAVQGEQGDVARGIESYRKALELQPAFAEAWSNLGDALGTTGDNAGEIEAYLRAIGSNPRLAPVWSNLGNALREDGWHVEAVSACRRALELDPDFAAGWNNLGNALLDTGQHEAAVAACESALRLAPGLAEAWSTLGAALHALGRHDDAIRAHRKAIEINPGAAHHHYSLGLALQHCGRGEEAIASYRRALAADPNHAQAHWDMSVALLESGELAEGWKEYEWRWRRRHAEARRYGFSAWDGDASKPRRLLLWAEQGVGDQILYGSMIPDLVSSRVGITLEVDPRLAPLFQRSFPGITVIPQRDPPAANPAGYDCQASLGSLGRWLRPSLEGFPRHPGYLKPDPLRAGEYRARLLGAQPAPLVGISWKSANREFGRYKSLSLNDWAGILQVPHVHFVDLQYGETASERERAERQAGARIEHLPEVDLYNDLEGLAALCAACDLVITASNVTAHVAGALGRPVWLLVPKANGRHWYWFSGRTGSPWYPSMRIFTQQTAGDWSGVLEAVAGELAAFIKSA